MGEYRSYSFQCRAYESPIMPGVVMIGEIYLAETLVSLRIPAADTELPDLTLAYEWFRAAVEKEAIPPLSRTKRALLPCVYAYVGEEWPDVRVPNGKGIVKVRVGESGTTRVNAEIIGNPLVLQCTTTVEYPVPSSRLTDGQGDPIYVIKEDALASFTQDPRPIVCHNGEFLVSLLQLMDKATGISDEIATKLRGQPVQVVIFRGDKTYGEFLARDLERLSSVTGRLRKPRLDIRSKVNTIVEALQHSPLIQAHFKIITETLTAERMKDKAMEGQPAQPISSIAGMVVKAIPRKQLEWASDDTPAKAAAAALPVAEFLVNALDSGMHDMAEDPNSLFHHPKFMSFVGMLKLAMDDLGLSPEERKQALGQVFTKDWTVGALKSFLRPAIVPRGLFEYGISGTILEKLLADRKTMAKTHPTDGDEENT